jgi:hypothetical protein
VGPVRPVVEFDVDVELELCFCRSVGVTKDELADFVVWGCDKTCGGGLAGVLVLMGAGTGLLRGVGRSPVPNVAELPPSSRPLERRVCSPRL